MQTLKSRLANGETIIGSWISTASPIVAEIMAHAGFDFLAVDAEHSPAGVAQSHQIFQGIRSGNRDCSPMVRVEGVSYHQIKRYLDSGATGIIAPLVNTSEQAEELVQAVKYPPIGNRGLGFCRANEYGVNVETGFAESNDETLAIVQIEHIDAVANIDAILSVPGIDAAFIGPFDLSASMGMAGKFEAPEVKQAIQATLDACKRHQVAPGIHVVKPDPDAVLRYESDGFRFLAFSLDITMLSESCKLGLAKIRKS